MDKTELSLVVILAVLKNDRSLFRKAIVELSASQSQDANLKSIKTIKYLLSEKQQKWLEGQLWKMWVDPQGKNKYLPYSAYSNRAIGEVKLTHTIHARLSEEEYKKIAEVAGSMGQSRSEWLRSVLTKELGLI